MPASEFENCEVSDDAGLNCIKCFKENGLYRKEIEGKYFGRCMSNSDESLKNLWVRHCETLMNEMEAGFLATNRPRCQKCEDFHEFESDSVKLVCKVKNCQDYDFTTGICKTCNPGY